MKSDAEIQQAVIQELRWDPRIAETDVGVEVDRGVVTLTGTVRSYAKRMAAQEAAHRVAGVRDVANDIRVKLPGDATRTDTEIAQAVRNVLEWHAFVPDERIRSTVSDGHVTLEGDVDFWQQREDAEHAVRNLALIRGVDNRILVKPPPIDAETVRTEIEAALERRAERAAKHLTVTVHDGTVVLSGPVRSWPEQRAVLGVARSTPGVIAVENHLRIDPYV